MLKKLSVLSLGMLLLVGDTVEAKMSELQKFVVTAGAVAVGTYVACKLVNYLTTEDEATFLRNSDELLVKIKGTYGSLIWINQWQNSLRGSSDEGACFCSLVNEILAVDTIDNYLKNLQDTITQLDKRVNWQQEQDSTTVDERRELLWQARSELIALSETVTKDCLQLHAKAAFLRNEYAAELQSLAEYGWTNSQLTKKAIIKAVLLRGQCCATSDVYFFLRYARELHKNRAELQKMYDLFTFNKQAEQFVPNAIESLLIDLTLIYDQVVVDAHYLAQKKAYDFEMYEQVQLDSNRLAVTAKFNYKD